MIARVKKMIHPHYLVNQAQWPVIMMMIQLTCPFQDSQIVDLKIITLTLWRMRMIALLMTLQVKIVSLQQAAYQRLRTLNPKKSQPSGQVKKEQDLSPHTIAQAYEVGDCTGRFIFKTLFDTGATSNMIKRSILPKQAKLIPIPQGEGIQTTNGNMKLTHYVVLDTVVFPEFSPTRHLKEIKALVFDGDVRYDLIIGRKTLKEMELSLDFADEKMKWIDQTVPFHPRNWFTDKEALRQVLKTPPAAVVQAERMDKYADSLFHEIKAAQYSKANLEEVAADQKHLTSKQRDDLLKVFRKHEPLFNGEVGKFPREVHLDVDPNVAPYYQARPYPIDHRHMKVLQDELDQQEKLGIIEKVNVPTPWCMPMFPREKKDGTIRTVHDFRWLNRAILRRLHTLPRIEDILLWMRVYEYLTKIDISMQYYAFHLDEESSWYCVFITPFGKYKLNRLAMGCVQSGDIAQAAMEEVFRDILHAIAVYMDDLLFHHMTWEEHIQMIDEVLGRLQAYGFTVNPRKCEWGVQETDFLGYWITREGSKPWIKRVEPILRMEKPKTLKELRRFIGMTNFYRSMYKERAKVLAPLTDMTKISKQAFHKHWGPEQDKAFEAAKAMIAQDVLLSYPDPNKEFIIDADASDYQLGGVVLQEVNEIERPIAYYSRKLTDAQKKYSVIEKELLTKLEILEQFRPFLWGRKIRIRGDHKNLSFDKAKSQRVRNWRLLVEDFSPTIEYIPGKDNVQADTLSRYPMKEEPMDQDELGEALLNYPSHVHQFPAQYDAIHQAQEADEELLNLLATKDEFETRTFDRFKLICWKGRGDRWRIVLPESLVTDVIDWYHIYLQHPGITRTLATINTIFYAPKLMNRVQERIGRCRPCMRQKNIGPGYGHIPERGDYPHPFEEVAVDLLGPWKIKVGGRTIELRALSCTDTGSNLTELPRIDSKTSKHITLKFENEWLSRYPRPFGVIHDNGGEFIGAAFQSMLATNGIKSIPTTVKNPQANAIAERTHLIIGDMVRTNVEDLNIANMRDANMMIDTVLASVRLGLRATVHTTLGVSPGAAVFQRDMLLNIPVTVDWEMVRQRRRAKITYNNERENARRRSKDYQIGEQVLVINHSRRKLAPKAIGPFEIDQVHANGTVTIQRAGGVFERINIRRIRPYVEQEVNG